MKASLNDWTVIKLQNHAPYWGHDCHFSIVDITKNTHFIVKNPEIYDVRPPKLSKRKIISLKIKPEKSFSEMMKKMGRRAIQLLR